MFFRKEGKIFTFLLQWQLYEIATTIDTIYAHFF